MKDTISHERYYKSRFSPTSNAHCYVPQGLRLRLFPESFFQFSISAFPHSPVVSLCRRLTRSAIMPSAHCPRKLKTIRPHLLVHDTCRCISCSDLVPAGWELGTRVPTCPIPDPSQAGYIQSHNGTDLVSLKGIWIT